MPPRCLSNGALNISRHGRIQLYRHVYRVVSGTLYRHSIRPRTGHCALRRGSHARGHPGSMMRTRRDPLARAPSERTEHGLHSALGVRGSTVESRKSEVGSWTRRKSERGPQGTCDSVNPFDAMTRGRGPWAALQTVQSHAGPLVGPGVRCPCQGPCRIAERGWRMPFSRARLPGVSGRSAAFR